MGKGTHQCGTCFGRFTDRCKMKGHMVPCDEHPDTYHVPSHACVSCNEVEDARVRAERDARADKRRADVEAREAMERIERGATDAKKEQKKAKKAEQKEEKREKRARRASEAGLSESTGKKVRRYEKRG